MVLADVEQHGLDALLLDDLAMRDGHAVGLFVQGDRGVEVLDGDADVVDPGEHPGPESSLPLGVLLRRRDAQVRQGPAALDARHALHDAVDLRALERLVLEQLGGDAVQQLAVGGDEVPRPRCASKASSRCSSSRMRRVRSESAWSLSAACGASPEPIAYWWIIAWVISSTRCRSLAAPVVTAPKTICSATRPPRRTVIWSTSSSRVLR
jgi:hypothetical protein